MEEFFLSGQNEKMIYFTVELISLRQALRNYIKYYINFIRLTFCITFLVKLHFLIIYNFITGILLVCKIIFKSACFIFYLNTPMFQMQSLQRCFTLLIALKIL